MRHLSVNGNKEGIEVDLETLRKREQEISKQTDDEILAQITHKFDVLHRMTRAVKAGNIHGLIVTGPTGVGKSFGVEENLFDSESACSTIVGNKLDCEIVSGASSGIMLYTKLWEWQSSNNVVCFDDCDSILREEDSLNVLKAALDSKKTRIIAWNKASKVLEKEGIPTKFEFNGGCVFITNIGFDFVRAGRLKEHLLALRSRCHYIDMGMTTIRERLLRVQQLVLEHGILDKYSFEDETHEQIMLFMYDNRESLNEISARTIVKIADLVQTFGEGWETIAAETCFKRGHKLLAK